MTPTPPSPPVVTTSVSVAPATLALTGLGVSGQLSATVNTSAGVAASPTVTWSSSNPGIATVAGTGTTATVTSVAPGTAQITASSGGQSGAATVTVTAAPQPSALTLSVSASLLTVQAGGPAGQLVARLQRTNLPGAVTLSASGVPAGLAVSFNPAVANGDSSQVTLTAVTTAVPGTYALTIQASASGVAAQTAALSVQVQAPPVPSGNVVLDLSSCTDPNGWMAVRNGETAPWVRVTGQTGRYRFDAAGERVSLAYRSFAQSRGAWTSVVHGTAAEIGALIPDQLCELATPISQRDPSPRQFGVQWQPPSWANFDNVAPVARLGAFWTPISSFPVAAIEGPATGEHDLFFLVANSSAFGNLIVRRNINVGALPNGSLLTAPIDFRSTESSALRSVTIPIDGVPPGGRVGFEPFIAVGDSCDALFMPRDQFSPGGVDFFLTGLQQRRSFQTAFGNPWGGRQIPEDALRPPTRPTAESVVGWPESRLLRPNELYGGIAAWWTGSVITPIRESRRVVQTSLTPDAVRLPSGMPEVTPTILPDTAYRRLRFQFLLPSDVADAAVVQYTGQSNGHALSIRQFRSQRSGSAVDLTTPDFTGVPGWDASLGPRGLTSFEVRGESNTRTNACRPGRTLTSSRFGVS